MLVLILACLGIGLLVLGMHRFGQELGLELLIVFVASIQFLQNLFLSTTYLRLGDDITVSPGSAILFPATFLVLLLVVIRDGVPNTRRLIYAILAANLLLVLLALAGLLGFRYGFVHTLPGAGAWLERFDFHIYVIGTGLLIIDAVLLIVMYATLQRLRWPLPLRVIASLVGVLLFDGVAFVLVTPDLPASLLPGQLVGKTVSGLTYGALLAGYLLKSPANPSAVASPEGTRFEMMDLFSILGYRRRYLDLQDRSRQIQQSTQQQIELLLDSTAQAIIGLDSSGRCTFSNPSARRMLGYRPDEDLHGEPFHELAHPTTNGESQLALEECPMCRVVVTGKAHSGEIEKTRRRDGSSFPVEYWAYPIRQEGRPPGSILTFRDVSERKQAEAELRALEERYRALFRDAPEMYVLTRATDAGPVIDECSTSFLETLGYTREEVLGRPLAKFYSEDSARQLLSGGYDRALEGTLSDTDRELVSSSGEIVQTLLRARPDTDSTGKIVGTRAIYVNITERKRIEALVRQSRERLRRLAKRLQTVREEERKSLAREMHDELGQALTALRFDLSWLQSRVEGRKPLVERTSAMLSIVDRLIDAVGDLSARLRPHVLDTLGLEAAIKWEAQRFSERSAIPCLVETSPDDPPVDHQLDAERTTALFRILQEALTNVARHAQATLVQIYLRRSTTELELEVLDNGKGIAAREIDSVRSSGLIGMRERVGALAGTIEIGRRATGGTRLSAKIPLGFAKLRQGRQM